MFVADVENSQDIRLNVRLFRACLPDKRKFCEDISPGNARVKNCLVDHMDDAGFGEECKCVMLHSLPQCRVLPVLLNDYLLN
jgi:golgi apparatus protein 1